MDEETQYAQLERIVSLVEWGRLDEAIKETENYIQQYPEDAGGYALLSKIYLVQEDFKKAWHWSQEALKNDPEHEVAWEARVGTLYTEGKYDKAMIEIEEAIKLFPEEDYFYFLEGNIHNQRRDYNKARESFLNALTFDSSNAMYLASYSYVESIAGNHELALQAEERALELEPEDPTVFMYAAWAADQRGDYLKSLHYLENAVRLQPDNAQVREEYLEILQKQYKVYRLFLVPSKLLTKVKPVFAFLIWFVAWILFKPLVAVFIVLYVAAHWTTKIIVNVKVFGRVFVKA